MEQCRSLGSDAGKLRRVTPETARLLRHWRHHRFTGVRPFFCQIEAVETAIWLAEVAPHAGRAGRRFLQYLEDAGEEANPGLLRLALKLATGAGKTTVMAMLIAWQTVNAVRRPRSRRFTRGFLVVTPGLTIRDRLRVLQPNDPDSYYRSRELVPNDLLPDLDRAKIVITNYHAFRRRERFEIAKGGRSLLQGRGPAPDTRESEGRMQRRVMPELMGMKHVLVLNDEAHHCYREKRGETDEAALKGDERKEAEKNREAARLWISGLEAVHRTLGVGRVIDLSATPFFLSGSGYAEGTLFPWTMCDFSLMDAIECGIVKLPRVPVADNVPGNEMPMYRELWKHIRTRMPGQGRGKAGGFLDPAGLPPELRTALDALYGHYEKTFGLWEEAGLPVPPCFIVVCHNIAASKLVYDYVSGFHRTREDGSRVLENGHFALFRNFDRDGRPFGRPRTLLINSEQFESGDAFDPSFRRMAAPEIDRFRREIVERTGDRRQAEDLGDEDLLREVMNTVGKAGRLGDSIRCVVSVSMLSEGWDASTVTHVLGVRAFGTQLLCEQVVGRALRRQSYEPDDDGRFPVEYADVLGIPFDFTATPVATPPRPPRETVHVKAVRPDRDPLEIRFPRVAGLRRRAARGPPQRRVQRRLGAGAHPRAGRGHRDPQLGDHRRIRGPRPRARRRRADLAGGLRAHRVPAFGQVPGRERRAAAVPVRATEAHRPPVAGCLPRLQGRDPRFAGHVQDHRRPRVPEARGRHHPLPAQGRESGQGRSRPVQSGRLDGARQLPHLEDEPVRDRRRPLPRQLGHPRQRLGGGAVPGGRAASASGGLGEEPQPRLRGAVPHRRAAPDLPPRLHRAARRRTRGKTTSCTWSSRSRATVGRTPRTRRRRWRPAGCRG